MVDGGDWPLTRNTGDLIHKPTQATASPNMLMGGTTGRWHPITDSIQNLAESDRSSWGTGGLEVPCSVEKRLVLGRMLIPQYPVNSEPASSVFSAFAPK
jgi:hypothetical protein